MDIDESEKVDSSFAKRREKELGFKPQNEQFHNFYLPYYSAKVIDEESKEILQQIKQNLGIAIATREIYPCSGVFVTKLMR